MEKGIAGTPHIQLTLVCKMGRGDSSVTQRPCYKLDRAIEHVSAGHVALQCYTQSFGQCQMKGAECRRGRSHLLLPLCVSSPLNSKRLPHCQEERVRLKVLLRSWRRGHVLPRPLLL